MTIIQNQNFGVEIELTGITRGNAAKVIADYYGTSSRYVGTGYKTYIATPSAAGQTYSSATIVEWKKRSMIGRENRTSSQIGTFCAANAVATVELGNGRAVHPLMNRAPQSANESVLRDNKKSSAGREPCGAHFFMRPLRRAARKTARGSHPPLQFLPPQQGRQFQ